LGGRLAEASVDVGVEVKVLVDAGFRSHRGLTATT